MTRKSIDHLPELTHVSKLDKSVTYSYRGAMMPAHGILMVEFDGWWIVLLEGDHLYAVHPELHRGAAVFVKEDEWVRADTLPALEKSPERLRQLVEMNCLEVGLDSDRLS